MSDTFRQGFRSSSEDAVRLLRSKAADVEQDCGQKQQEADEDEQQDEFPCPSDPFHVWYAGHSEYGHEHSRGRGNHVCESVAELEGEDGCLA